jgi:homoserine dehydrogenase
MKLHPTIVGLLEEIDAFIAERGMTPTAFGWEAIKDPNLYRSLKSGRNPRLETMDRIRAFLREDKDAAA